MDSSSSYDQGNRSTRFLYNPNDDQSQGSSEFCGILEIYVHHARNIHNICIYEKQDVYAKFSLTYNPDETFSTRIVNGGGKNPEFNDKLVIKINQFDALLKCEMWMLSRAKNFMEDQLLGFSLVPISLVIEKGELTQDFSLSSTDLFHSPAGTVKLSLSIMNHNIIGSTTTTNNNSSITSEVVLLDPSEYSRIEFPDMNVVKENQQMVSEYFGHGSFLCLGASHDDYEMAGSISPKDNSGFFSSTITSLSDDRNSGDSLEKKNINSLVGDQSSNSCVNVESSSLGGEKEKKDVKEESEIMQQQIVDMYMRSMQQFTESLAKMKLPMNLENTETQVDHAGDVIHTVDIENKKKDAARVFYGSRAFF